MCSYFGQLLKLTGQLLAISGFLWAYVVAIFSVGLEIVLAVLALACLMKWELPNDRVWGDSSHLCWWHIAQRLAATYQGFRTETRCLCCINLNSFWLTVFLIWSWVIFLDCRIAQCVWDKEMPVVNYSFCWDWLGRVKQRRVLLEAWAWLRYGLTN